MDFSQKIKALIELTHLNEDDIRGILKRIGGSHANTSRWIIGSVEPNPKNRAAIGKALKDELKNFEPHWIDLSTEAFREKISFIVDNNKINGFFSTLIGENVEEFKNLDFDEKKLQGYYILTRKHSSDEAICRELLRIKSFNNNGLCCSLITYKGGIYHGYAFKNERIVYVYMGRKQERFGFCGRTILFWTTPGDSNSSIFSGILTRITTNIGAPIASYILGQRMADLQDSHRDEIDMIFQQPKDFKVPADHWLRIDNNWMINKIDPRESEDQDIRASWMFLTANGDSNIKAQDIDETRANLKMFKEKWQASSVVGSTQKRIIPS